MGTPIDVCAMCGVDSQSWAMNWLQCALATPVVLWLGRNFFMNSMRLAKKKQANMDTLIALGSGISYAYSIGALVLGTPQYLHFEAAAAITTLVLVGRYLEAGAKLKANDAVQGWNI